jgi:fructokinase
MHQFSVNCPVCGSWLPRYQPVTIDATKQVLQRVASTSVFFFDRASRGALLLAKSYAAAGALIVYEPSGQASDELFQEALELAHICKYSVEQFASFRWKRNARPLLEVQTMGDEGVRYRSSLSTTSDENWEFIPASLVGLVKDAAGAGDWFSAGLIYVMGQESLAGFKTTSQVVVQSAISFAKTLAAWNCQYEGARGGMYAVSKAEFWKEIRHLLSGEKSSFGAHRKMRSARLTNFRCPVASCRVRSGC